MANFRLTFPVKGINKSRVPEDQPEMTSPDMNNVRAFDVLDERIRGGQRPGMKKRYSEWVTNVASGTGPIVGMCEVSITEL
ncbi:hypothetical protein LCGC14_0594240 [marine sediment metagenome]|uniref:Uncharacterized protein n=1 Tax=marine sediment metagenome TaxID=412755 RepID=A0A0F9RW91_9ZZZZ